MTCLFAPHALLPTGWAQGVLLQWNASGHFTQVHTGATCPPGAARAAGPVVPALPNLHSHAFQRAFAGLTEYRAGGVDVVADSFWSWRDLMYRFAGRITPEALEAIATWAYIEMLEAGYTHVCEFQYVHHQPDGTPYVDDAAMCHAILRAARSAGIGLTLLPVLYQSSGFGAQPPTQGQGRFIRSTDSMLLLLEQLNKEIPRLGGDLTLNQGPATRLGLAPHSLRAVPPDALREAVAGMHAIDPRAPIHIHIAEQTKEVDDCLAWSGQRPVDWLLDHAPVDARWCLVHATHMSDAEYQRAAATGAVAGLCPSTEANLGDGVFDLPRWRQHGGAWGIGSDSHVCINAAEEVMLLEYTQRLTRRARNVGATDAQPDTATALWLQAVAGGAQASGVAIGGLAAGQRADFLVLDAQHIALQGLPAEQALAAHVFASGRGSALAQTWVAGTCVVLEGRYSGRGHARQRFAQARTGLLRDV
ncbi:formimidoylglutamate deiminase [Ottowia testudinis]|uniref:Formimidoylglutamate deiminase n=1 Tax=Ottowia testudinis TaxID=2816950 RepID=A0A975CG11_9BURK|nr:formimidoylglutamate deiminase [Ottowia testudinis]QTD45725.1 formimidoylglutamate deiminase [Ottowia testudinis]